MQILLYKYLQDLPYLASWVEKFKELEGMCLLFENRIESLDEMFNAANCQIPNEP